MKTLIIIPIQNAYKNILEIIENIKKWAPGVDYIVVDHGSSDRTKYLLENNEINRLEIPISMSYNNGLSLGVKYAYANKYDYCLQLDQSEWLDYKELKYFITTIQNKKTNMVLGSRFIDKPMPWSIKYWMQHFLRFIIRIYSKKKVTDPHLRFKIFDRKIMKEVINHSEWCVDPDAIANLIKAGYTFSEIQVKNNKGKKLIFNYSGFKGAFHTWVQIVSILFVQPFRKRKKKGKKHG